MMHRGLIFLLLTLGAAPHPFVPSTHESAALLGEAVAAPSPAAAVPRSLPFFYDLYSFRGDRGVTTIIAGIAVPVRRLKGERQDRGFRYRFDVMVVLADTAEHNVYRSDDSVYVSVPQPLPGDHLLYTHIELEAPPSASTLHRVIMTDANNPGVGQLYTSPYPIPDYSGDELMLSDIALGQPNVRKGWKRGEATLALLPTGLLPGSSFDLYYEIYNLPAGTPFGTEISIEPVDDEGNLREDGAGGVRANFSGSVAAGSDGLQEELRRIEASLETGRYRLTVTVNDQTTGAVARRSRLFRVRGPGRGATIVPALSALRTARR